MDNMREDKDGCKETTVPLKLTVDEARQIAFEALRVVTTMPGLEDIKDLIGRELDISDELMEHAVALLFSDLQPVNHNICEK